MTGDLVQLDVVPSPEPSESGPITGMARRALVRALAALLVADVRRGPEAEPETPAASAPEADSGVSQGGSARTVVGRLHPRAVTPHDFDCSPLRAVPTARTA